MFRFTIRDVLWVMVVVGILATFWAREYHARQAAVEAERRAVEAAKRMADLRKKELRGEVILPPSPR
jgi:hypothetical protein